MSLLTPPRPAYKVHVSPPIVEGEDFPLEFFVAELEEPPSVVDEPTVRVGAVVATNWCGIGEVVEYKEMNGVPAWKLAQMVVCQNGEFFRPRKATHYWVFTSEIVAIWRGGRKS